MKGYILNSIFVLVGSFIGLFLGRHINEKIKNSVFNALGLFTFFIGIKIALSCKDIIPVVFCIVLGTFLGSFFNIEENLSLFLEKLNKKISSSKGNIEGFITASTLFCVGSMTIIGSIKDGLYNDALLIKTKSVMDGFASIILSSKYGVSVVYSVASVFIIQGVLTMFSTQLTVLASNKMMEYIDGVGGILVLGIAFNLLNLKEIKTLNMLPSLIFIIMYGLLVTHG